MYFKGFIDRFRDDESGVISIGILFAVPILVWALLSTYVYFDVFRAELVSNKAAITIADMISREEEAITDDYIDGALELLKLLIEEDDDPQLRITVFWYDQGNDTYELAWSEARGFASALDAGDLANMYNTIPQMADGDRAILVETASGYRQPITYSIGPFSGADLNDVEFSTFTITKPRFLTSQFCFDDDATNDTNALDC